MLKQSDECYFCKWVGKLSCCWLPLKMTNYEDFNLDGAVTSLLLDFFPHFFFRSLLSLFSPHFFPHDDTIAATNLACLFHFPPPFIYITRLSTIRISIIIIIAGMSDMVAGAVTTSLAAPPALTATAKARLWQTRGSLKLTTHLALCKRLS